MSEISVTHQDIVAEITAQRNSAYDALAVANAKGAALARAVNERDVKIAELEARLKRFEPQAVDDAANVEAEEIGA